jgi:hypothetical protein
MESFHVRDPRATSINLKVSGIFTNSFQTAANWSVPEIISRVGNIFYIKSGPLSTFLALAPLIAQECGVWIR